MRSPERTGALTGAIVTAIIQSSSVTTVLVVGFISAGLMTLTQGIPVVLGANVGTTATAFLASIDLGPWAYLLVAAGFFTSIIAKRERMVQLGVAIASLGVILVGLEIMKESMVPLRGWEPFINIMTAASKPLIGIFLGLIFTATVQSSSAATGVAVALASQGLLGLEGGIAIVFGANVGTCVTAVLAALAKPRDAQRIAAVHVTYNVLGVVLWFAFIPALAQFVHRFASETAVQLAFANLFFNAVNAVLFLPFVGALASFVRRILPELTKPTVPTCDERLDPDLIETPALALEVAWNETRAQASKGGAMSTSRTRLTSLSRRAFVIGVTALTTGIAGLKRVLGANATSPMSPDAALEELKLGNATFAELMSQTRRQTIEERVSLGAGQAPFASLLSCGDSRTTPEIIFNQGLGDIFVVRVAGNIATESEVGSLEYASAVLKSPLIVVMGHSACGAVKAAIELTKGQTFPGSIQAIAARIKPAAESTEHQHGDWAMNAAKENVALSIRNLQASPVLSELVKAGQLKIVGAYYQLETGVVTFA